MNKTQSETVGILYNMYNMYSIETSIATLLLPPACNVGVQYRDTVFGL